METDKLRQLPAVDKLLHETEVEKLTATHGRELVAHAARAAINAARAAVIEGEEPPSLPSLILNMQEIITLIAGRSLKPVINATGVILHTNLGRAPLGQKAVDEIADTARGYANVEFDLAGGCRGSRSAHIREVLRFLTGAEDVLVVNNNAAAIMLALHTLAAQREVIVSRGELIEIGGSFRIPEIMATSGATMKEVGTTNRTRIADFESAITPDTALLFKAHKSNYAVKGFTQDVSLEELVALAADRGLPLLYDIGSGLLDKVDSGPLKDEPDVRSALALGVDLVAFSCDKLLGGPQAGVIAGKSAIIDQLAHTPMMRTLRVGKLTLAALSVACRSYLTDNATDNPTRAMIQRPQAELDSLATALMDALKELGMQAKVIDSFGQCGGGTMPELKLDSRAVELLPLDGIGDSKKTFAETVYAKLLDLDLPVLAVLREGSLIFDVLTISENDVAALASAIGNAVTQSRPVPE